MNNKKSMILGLFAITLLSVGAVSLANAYMGKTSEVGPNYNAERHAIMEKAFETNDYNLWKSQMTGKGAMNKINESNFAKFAEAHRLMNEGKNDEANKIRQELGLGGNGDGNGTCSSEGKDGQNGNCGGGNGGCGMMNK